jgi:hypothetical protein
MPGILLSGRQECVTQTILTQLDVVRQRRNVMLKLQGPVEEKRKESEIDPDVEHDELEPDEDDDDEFEDDDDPEDTEEKLKRPT